MIYGEVLLFMHGYTPHEDFWRMLNADAKPVSILPIVYVNDLDHEECIFLVKGISILQWNTLSTNTTKSVLMHT